ncbi:hypothetical protein EBAPG3_008760 [Nitrosospira lacus]|uniref:Uncharacterized protein n=1 Tax=Nitrosospira lacus TaxID=1288494 RepID=A0A1W6SPW2_9PROT|nr:hypothetical protein [Nitrosospira lacus]ARO87848.1 hypothetical protein EBAPG3_008760 [Nitrosospira lacus]
MAAKSRPGSGGYGISRAGTFSGKNADAGIVADAFLSTRTVSAGIKKPGIPSGTPEWLKTMLETIIGRRGNAIEVPGFQTLTFSASPTKAECEALYSYTNQIRQSVENILARLDS